MGIGLLLLECETALSDVRQSLQTRAVPVGMLETGPLGKILRRLSLVRAEPNDDARFPPGAGQLPTIFRRKRRVGENMFVASTGRAGAFSSSLAVEESHFQPGWPLISVVADKADLYDPDRGIFIKANSRERGRDWERMAYVSYFERGRLMFASAVGLRLHGGASRRQPRQKRVRLYFRDEYGADRFPPGLIFGGESYALSTLVVRTDHQHFACPLAFDISRRIGAVAPKTWPVIFVLNGESLGQYYLTEHLSRKRWESRLGHTNFYFYRYRDVPRRFQSEDGLADSDEYRRLIYLVRNTRVPLTVEAVEQCVDIDNLTRHLLSVAFCGTNDWTQGILFLDKSRPDPRWTWINWDMDHSFVDYGAPWKRGKRPRWRQEALELLFSHRDFLERENPERPITQGDMRKVLFTRLWKASPEYRDYFVRLTTDLLNHRIDRDYLLSRLAFYRDVMGVEIPETRDEFMLHRGEFIREELQRYFDAGDVYRVSIAGPEGLSIEVDGYSEDIPYEGSYFNGQLVTIRVAEPGGPGVAAWRVNGRVLGGSAVSVAVTADLIIEPVLD
jgi:hypothetical protein